MTDQQTSSISLPYKLHFVTSQAVSQWKKTSPTGTELLGLNPSNHLTSFNCWYGSIVGVNNRDLIDKCYLNPLPPTNADLVWDGSCDNHMALIMAAILNARALNLFVTRFIEHSSKMIFSTTGLLGPDTRQIFSAVRINRQLNTDRFVKTAFVSIMNNEPYEAEEAVPIFDKMVTG